MLEINNFRQKLLSITIPCLLGWTFTYLAINFFKDYAYGLFVWLPLVLGLTIGLLYMVIAMVKDKNYD